MGALAWLSGHSSAQKSGPAPASTTAVFSQTPSPEQTAPLNSSGQSKREVPVQRNPPKLCCLVICLGKAMTAQDQPTTVIRQLLAIG